MFVIVTGDVRLMQVPTGPRPYRVASRQFTPAAPAALRFASKGPTPIFHSAPLSLYPTLNQSGPSSPSPSLYFQMPFSDTNSFDAQLSKTKLSTGSRFWAEVVS